MTFLEPSKEGPVRGPKNAKKKKKQTKKKKRKRRNRKTKKKVGAWDVKVRIKGRKLSLPSQDRSAELACPKRRLWTFREVYLGSLGLLGFRCSGVLGFGDKNRKQNNKEQTKNNKKMKSKTKTKRLEEKKRKRKRRK